MKAVLALLGLVLQILGARSLIVPDQLPTLLSVIYSNIPTIKKGTDSRIGWGFRLGNRADFQVLVELGPQTNTQPLANQDSSASSSKRNIPHNLRNTLYALQQSSKQQTPSTGGEKWIEQWKESMEAAKESELLPVEPRPGLGIGEIDAKSVIPNDATLALRELYKQKDTKADGLEELYEKKNDTTEGAAGPKKEEKLDDVSMDEK